MTTIPVARYRPDVSSFQSTYTDQIANVFCGSASYTPAHSLASLTSALPELPLNAFTAKGSDTSINIFVGTATKLYKLNNTTLVWDDVSNGVYSASQEFTWSFASFGNFVIAVNQTNDPQVYEIGVDTAFRNLGGSPPRAGIVRIWGDFVALMNLASNPARVQWSGLNNAEFWTPGTQNSDYQDFPDGGNVQSSSEATNPLIFLQSSIYRATFVPGSVEIFTFQKIHDKRGAKSASSVTSRGSYIFYCDEGGFYQIGPDGALTSIGFEKVDKTIFGNLQASSISRIVGVVDPFHSRVYWALDYTGSGVFDQLITYDWNIQEWTPVNSNFYVLFPLLTVGYTLESLNSISASIEDLPFPLDSKAWQGGAPILGAFDIDFKLAAFQGPNLEATVVTQEFGDPAGQVVRTTRAYPIVDAENTLISIGQRFRRNDSVVWLAEQYPSYNTGQIRKRSRSRFHRFKIRIPAEETWTHLQGIDTDFTPAGSR